MMVMMGDDGDEGGCVICCSRPPTEVFHLTASMLSAKDKRRCSSAPERSRFSSSI
jgi:hypothetical protein